MDARIVLDRVAAALGVAGLLIAFPFYLASGLAAPLWAIVLLLIFWGFLAWLAVKWFRARPWQVLPLPFIAAAVWWATLTIGENVLGWQA